MTGAPTAPDSTPAAAERVPQRSTRDRRRPWFALIGAVVVLAVAIAGWAVADALLARSALQDAKADISRLAAEANPTETQAQQQVHAALVAAEHAEGLLSQPGSAILAHLPLLGRSWVAERGVAQASTAVLRVAGPLLDAASHVGTGRRLDLAALQRLARQLDTAHALVAGPLARLAALDTGFTPGPVGAAVAEAQHRLLPVGPDLARAAAGARALGAIFGGRHTVLVGLENNAELRATGGLIGSVAIAHTGGGRIRVGRFHDVSSQLAASPGFVHRVPAPSDYRRAYQAFLANTTLWKNVNFSPSVPDSATVLSRVAGTSLGTRPDTVLLLDVPAIAALVDGAGLTVRLPDGTTATGASLEHDLLVQTYGAATGSSAAEEQRRRQLEHAADAAVRQALREPPSLSLLRALGEQIAGRHLVAWSTQPQIETELTAAGASGAVTPSGGASAGTVTLLAAADNLGDHPGAGNKLDYYAQRSVAIRAAVGRTSATVQETVTVHNAAPAGLGSYVEGSRHPGRLSELWNLVLPGSARFTGLTVNGSPAGVRLVRIDGEQEALVPTVTPRGATSTVVLEFTVPVTGGGFRLQAIPQPLARPATLTVDIYGTGGAGVAPVRSGPAPFASVENFSVPVS